MAKITLEGVTKVYPDGTVAVSSLDLDVRDGELMVLVGPSGCGKSTALLMVAGLVRMTSGTLRIGDRVVNHIPAKDRDVAMIFQNYALYPHMSVYKNMAFGLKLRGVPRRVIARRVEEIARVLELEKLLSRKPASLSGGQRQRVAMGRAIVREPQVFLMDEPLSNLDAKLRVQMRTEISRIQAALRATTIYVTHDQTEAMTMGDRVAVLRDGVLQQIDTPGALYERPANRFVAGFIGSPAMNLVEAEVVSENGDLHLSFGESRLRLDETTLDIHPALRGYEGRQVIVGIRPENFKDAALTPGVPPDQRMTAVVELKESLGSELLVYFTPGVRTLERPDAESGGEGDGEEFETLRYRTKQAKETLIARVSPDSTMREGDKVEFALEARRLHLFDRETEAAIYE